MIPEDRRKKILNLLKNNKNVTPEFLSERLNISIPTIYRDLDVLEKQNNIRKVYGGIKLIENNQVEKNYYKRFERNKKLKKAIAMEAIKLINDGETIVMDESSTVHYLAEEITKMDFSLTIITNSILIIPEFVNINKIKIISTGGVLDQEICGLVGPIAQNTIHQFRADKFFFSSAGISSEMGVLDAYIPESISVKKSFLEISDKVICLVDSEKFSKSGPVNYINYDRLKMIITDELIDGEIVKTLNKKGVEVIVAKI
jgi:DeoR/GlpR family transcriptional regulator of sugar metabolism